MDSVVVVVVLVWWLADGLSKTSFLLPSLSRRQKNNMQQCCCSLLQQYLSFDDKQKASGKYSSVSVGIMLMAHDEEEKRIKMWKRGVTGRLVSWLRFLSRVCLSCRIVSQQQWFSCSVKMKYLHTIYLPVYMLTLMLDKKHWFKFCSGWGHCEKANAWATSVEKKGECGCYLFISHRMTMEIKNGHHHHHNLFCSSFFVSVILTDVYTCVL